MKNLSLLIIFALLPSLASATAYRRNGFIVVPTTASPSFTGTTVNGRAGVSAINGITVTTTSEVSAWLTQVSGASGTMTVKSVTIATEFSDQLAAASYSSKIKYLVPFLGSNLQACVCVLRNTLAVGSMSVSGAGTAGCTESTGLHGDGNVQFDMKCKVTDLNSGAVAGLGYWENNIDFTGGNVDPIGAYNNAASQRYTIDLRNTSKSFRWGSDIGGGPSVGTAATNAHYYGQNTSSTARALYIDGSSVATSTNSATTTGAGDKNIFVIGANNGDGGWKGRCAVVYLTDGTMSSGDISAFHTLLINYLFVPTGRPQT